MMLQKIAKICSNHVFSMLVYKCKQMGHSQKQTKSEKCFEAKVAHYIAKSKYHLGFDDPMYFYELVETIILSQNC